MHSMNSYSLYEKQSRLARKIKQLQEEISLLPSGELQICRNGKYTRWRISYGSKVESLPKRNYEMAQKLAKKKYISCELDGLKQELAALNSYISNLESIESQSNFLSSNPQYIELLPGQYIKHFGKYEEWAIGPYKANEKHPEGLIHMCKAGKFLRSKSEVIIANALYEHRIPFRYEETLELGDIVVHPDFTIIDPVSEKTVYWEHFGIMDDEKYMNSWEQKMRIYIQNGIVPGIQLICTYETKEHPINSMQVQKIIDNHFASIDSRVLF